MNTFNGMKRDMDTIKREKQQAAKASMEFVDDGMIVGLGTGSTAEFMLRYLGGQVKDGLQIVGVPSSDKTAKLAKELGIPLTTLSEVDRLDIYIDGADEIDGNFFDCKYEVRLVQVFVHFESLAFELPIVEDTNWGWLNDDINVQIVF